MLFRLVVLLSVLVSGAPAHAFDFRNPQLESQVEALFAGNRDMADIKLSIDRMVQPGVDVAASLKLIDRLAADVERMRAMAGATGDFEKLAVLRRFLYEPGPWNGGKAFVYDPDDPRGERPENRLLTDYLLDRRGNCVSMPMLMMVLGNRMGLAMTLAEAPEHLFVKFTDSHGRQWNLEATSGGGFARDSHFRKNMPSMTDAAIANGIYLRGQTRDEMIAHIVSGMLVGHLMEVGRLEDAMAVADLLLAHAPDSVRLKLTRASILALFLKRDVTSRYRKLSEMTPDVRAHAEELYRQNIEVFAEAEALGWRETGRKY